MSVYFEFCDVAAISLTEGELFGNFKDICIVECEPAIIKEWSDKGIVMSHVNSSIVDEDRMQMISIARFSTSILLLVGSSDQRLTIIFVFLFCKYRVKIQDFTEFELLVIFDCL